jgi:hypothetical protein
MRRAQDVETGEPLTVTGFSKGIFANFCSCQLENILSLSDGKRQVKSSKLREWAGMNVGSKEEALAVEDSHALYWLQSPHPEYADLYYESKAPICFATWVVQSIDEHIMWRNQSLEAIGTMFVVSSIIYLIDFY